MLRVARMYVRDQAVAEEVVQETWLAVINGIERFEGRSSLQTWLFRILTNRAKTRGEREGRSVPFSALAAPRPPPTAARPSTPTASSPPTTRATPYAWAVLPAPGPRSA